MWNCSFHWINIENMFTNWYVYSAAFYAYSIFSMVIDAGVQFWLLIYVKWYISWHFIIYSIGHSRPMGCRCCYTEWINLLSDNITFVSCLCCFALNIRKFRLYLTAEAWLGPECPEMPIWSSISPKGHMSLCYSLTSLGYWWLFKSKSNHYCLPPE